ncbi:MAG: hypothetical protein SFT81_01335 [Candidatus Caenarcaniphilales bacterium]|nr:hypothetical protein [Candidatus Caenarcaniphilales bacterium]
MSNSYSLAINLNYSNGTYGQTTWTKSLSGINHTDEVNGDKKLHSSDGLKQLTDRIDIGGGKKASLWQVKETDGSTVTNLNVDSPDGNTNVFRVKPGQEDKFKQALENASSKNSDPSTKSSGGNHGDDKDLILEIQKADRKGENEKSNNLEYLFTYQTDNKGPIKYGDQQVGFNNDKGEGFVVVDKNGEELKSPKKGSYSGNEIYAIYNEGKKPFENESSQSSHHSSGSDNYHPDDGNQYEITLSFSYNPYGSSLDIPSSPTKPSSSSSNYNNQNTSNDYNVSDNTIIVNRSLVLVTA